jgi:hypothetical protein
MRRCPRWLLAWFDWSGRIPVWARHLWPGLHFCNELDGSLETRRHDFCGPYCR